MKVYLNEINGLWAAIDAMYFSKRTWTREAEAELMNMYRDNYDRFGKRIRYVITPEFNNLMDNLFKWSTSHITLAKFLDFTFTVEGLHRGAQDDFDSHAKRLDNRIVRSSTRLSKFGDEKSDWYKDRILSTDEVLKMVDIPKPAEIVVDGVTYVACTNGYVREDLKDDKDTLRGLYMLSIPSNFIFKCNGTEFAHIINERDSESHAAPELRLMIEECKRLIVQEIPQYNTDWCRKVKN
jgi:hypothetical protein